MFQEYKKIRNKIRKYNPLDIVSQAISILNTPDLIYTEKYSLYPPWLLMLLVEWALLEQGNEQYTTKPLSLKNFNILVNMLKDLDGKQQLPSHEGGLLLLFRKMAFQQFWWRKELNKCDFGRQVELLVTLPETPYFNESFINTTNIDLHTYIRLTVALVSLFVTSPKALYTTKIPFRSLQSHINHKTVDHFFKLISLGPREAAAFLKENKWAKSSLQQQLFLETPLQMAPLLNINEKYFSYARALLYHSAQNLAYDLLRANDPYVFAQNFSKVFQKYVERSLKYAGLDYITEDGIKSRTKSSNKVVDFLVVENGINVFIEAKAVEMPALGKASHEKNIIADKTKTHLVKAIDQALSTANDLNTTECGIDVSKPNRNFLLIATYKDMYVGGGRDYYNFIAKDKIDNILNKYGKDSLLIPIDNVYTISAEELDVIVTHLNEGNVTIRKLLETAVENDAKPSTGKLLLSQHLPGSVRGDELPAYLEKATKLAFKDTVALLAN